MKNTTIAIDLAKSVFEIGISDRPGHIARNHRLSRTELAAFVAAQPPATVVMEACSSAHYWGRKFEGFGHDVKLLPPFARRAPCGSIPPAAFSANSASSSRPELPRFPIMFKV